jgi:hypothetical protein
MQIYVLMAGNKKDYGIKFKITGEKLINPCTKDCILLYKRINCSVQKIVFFCTRA